MRTDSVKWLWQIAIIKMIVEKAKIISTTTIYKLRRAFFFYFIGFEMKKPKYCTRASGHLNIVTALFVRLFVFSIMCSLSIVMVEKKNLTPNLLWISILRKLRWIFYDLWSKSANILVFFSGAHSWKRSQKTTSSISTIPLFTIPCHLSFGSLSLSVSKFISILYK